MIAPWVYGLAGRLEGVSPRRLGHDPGDLTRCLRMAWKLFGYDAVTLLVAPETAATCLEAARRLATELAGRAVVAAVLPGAGLARDEDTADEAYQETARWARKFCEAGARLLFVADPDPAFPAGLQPVWNVAAFYRVPALLHTRHPVPEVPMLALPEPVPGAWWQAPLAVGAEAGAAGCVGITTPGEVPADMPPEQLMAWVRRARALLHGGAP